MSNESFNQAPSHLQKSDTAVGFYLLAMAFFVRVSAPTWMLLGLISTVAAEVLTALAVLFWWRGTSHRLEKSCGFVLLGLQVVLLGLLVISLGLLLTEWFSPETAFGIKSARFNHVGSHLAFVFRWAVMTGLCGLLVLRTLQQHGKQTAIWSWVAFCLSAAQLALSVVGILSAVGILPPDWVKRLYPLYTWEWLLSIGMLAFWIYQASLCAKTTHHHTEPFEPSNFAMLTCLRVMYVLLFLLLVFLLLVFWVLPSFAGLSWHNWKGYTLFRGILAGLGLFVLWGMVALAWYSRKTTSMPWFAIAGLTAGIAYSLMSTRSIVPSVLFAIVVLVIVGSLIK